MTIQVEQPVAGRTTDAICRQIDEEHVRVDGRDLTLPVQIADCSVLLNDFFVDAVAAQRLLEGTGLTAARVLPGRSVLLLMAVDYRDSPLGAYGEVAVLLSAYPPGEGNRLWFGGAMSSLMMSLPYFVYRMPVDQEFTAHAGRFIWGYPKYLAKIDTQFEGERARAQLTQDAEFVVSFEAAAVPRAGGDGKEGASLSDRTGWNLTYRDGRLRRIPAKLGGSGIGWRLGGAPPSLGENHPLALDLRALGLPKRPLLSASSVRMRMTFGVAEPV
jgi:hypothetical protein